MNYLISQITISLLLAAIVGAAIGWLIHRSKASKQIRNLQQVVGRQQQHVNEAQTEVSIISGDFDDLKQRSEAQISELRTENQKIPALHQNLEKSQLLVRQLMQQHKAEMDELSVENGKLKSKARLSDDREQTIKKLQAELATEKLNKPEKDSKGKSNNAVSAVNSVQANSAQSKNNKSHQAAKTESNDDSENHSSDSAKNENGAHQLSAQQNDTSGSETVSKRLPLSANTATNNVSHVSGTEALNRFSAGTHISGDTENTSVSADADNAASTNVTEQDEKVQTELELEALRDQLAEDNLSTNVNGISGNTSDLSESDIESDDVTPLFDPVDQHDDLKQIFGIGPVTEKTLNKLGITAYSQLAELKQHDIKKIADALQIFPGRIERDNWVGSARSQLEEVLEEL